MLAKAFKIQDVFKAHQIIIFWQIFLNHSLYKLNKKKEILKTVIIRIYYFLKSKSICNTFVVLEFLFPLKIQSKVGGFQFPQKEANSMRN